MIRPIHFLIIAFLSAKFAFTEDIVLSYLNDIYPDAYVKVTSIDSQAGKVLDTRDTNLISSQLCFFHSDINFSALGNMIIHKFNDKNDIYENDDTQFRKINPPIQLGKDPAYSPILISPDESILIVKTYNQDKQWALLRFYDFIKYTMKAEYKVPYSDYMQMNEDASVLLITDPTGWIRIVERKDNEFMEFPTNISKGRIYDSQISYDGKRIVYQRFLGDYKYKLSYIDRLIDGWSEPKDIPLKDENGNDIIFPQIFIYDLANNGKTILFNFYYDFIFDRKPAIIHEINGSWTNPEYIEYELRDVGTRYDKGVGEQFLISEDGNVIAVQNLVKVWGGNTYFYEVYVLLKSPEGKWIRHNINPEGILVAPDMFLTKDGSKLFWLPTGLPGSVPSSVRNAMQY